MKINIICIGNLKEKYFKDALSEYQKRLSRFVKLEIIELKEEKLRDDSLAEEERVKECETKQLIDTISKISESYNILLDVVGKELSSPELAKKIDDLINSNTSSYKAINFIVGGSLGYTDELRKKADYCLSFSKMTFPHQMMRVILLEQIYRSFKISNNESYHK